MILRIKIIYLLIYIVFFLLGNSDICTCNSKYEADYNRALTGGLKFLKSIEHKINPITLRNNHGMKGKKFFVEYISTYLVLYQHARSEEEKQQYKKRVESVIAPVYTEDYHNLVNTDFKTFKEDVISYLNACRILELFGFDTEYYRTKLEETLPRIISNEHLSIRGVDNTMAIVYHLKSLGYFCPATYQQQYNRPECVVRTHPQLELQDLNNPYQRARVYDLTHEIFFLTNHGETAMQCVDTDDMNYIVEMVPKLIRLFIMRRNPDLVAELLICLNYLNMKKLPEYELAIEYLLKNQNPNGSWGSYDDVAKYVAIHRPKYQVDVGQYLHTTSVALKALCLSFR